MAKIAIGIVLILLFYLIPVVIGDGNWVEGFQVIFVIGGFLLVAYILGSFVLAFI